MHNISPIEDLVDYWWNQVRGRADFHWLPRDLPVTGTGNSMKKMKRGATNELGKGGVQAYLFEQVELHGGMCEHFKSPGKAGVPDCIVTWPAFGFARVHFVETKTIGGELSEGQKRDHARRKKLNCHTFVIWTKAQVDDYVQRFRPDIVENELMEEYDY